jgi:hypothetical protein
VGDLGGVVGGGDEIDVVGPSRLKGEHHLGEFPDRDGLAVAQVADGVVLAKNTSQIAVCEKDGSRSPGAGDGRLFSKVEVMAGNLGKLQGAADSRFPCHTFHAAFARTDLTGLGEAIEGSKSRGVSHPSNNI